MVLRFPNIRHLYSGNPVLHHARGQSPPPPRDLAEASAPVARPGFATLRRSRNGPRGAMAADDSRERPYPRRGPLTGLYARCLPLPRLPLSQRPAEMQYSGESPY